MIVLDFIQMLKAIKQRKIAEVKKLLVQSRAKHSTNERKLLNRLNNLRTGPNNHVFVGGNRAIWTIKELSKRMKRMVKLIGLDPTSAYSNYP